MYNKEPAPITVHHITSGRADKDLGRAVNDVIEYLPENDWICLRDIDTMPLHHRVFFKQCQDIAEAGEFDLVGCMTNRLGLTYQLHDGKLSENWDVRHHIKIAEDRYNYYGSQVEEIEGTVAGVMMLFPKRVWYDIGMFPEGGVQLNGSFVDYIVNEKVRKIGGKIGIAPGIYLFHIYRAWAANVRMGWQHIANN